MNLPYRDEAWNVSSYIVVKWPWVVARFETVLHRRVTQ